MNDSNYLKSEYIIPVFSTVWVIIYLFLGIQQIYDIIGLLISQLFLGAVVVNAVQKPSVATRFRGVLGVLHIIFGVIFLLFNLSLIRVSQFITLGVILIATVLSSVLQLGSSGTASTPSGRSPSPEPSPEPEPGPGPEPM
jgi:K+-sensing histidine kinase KdpD